MMSRNMSMACLPYSKSMDIGARLSITSIDHVFVVYIVEEHIGDSLLSSLVISMKFSHCKTECAINYLG